MDYLILVISGFISGVLLSVAVLLIELNEDLKREITLYSKLIKESEKENDNNE